MMRFNFDRKMGGGKVHCGICKSKAKIFREVDGVQYFECTECDFIFADPVFLARIDAGENVRKYDENYWKSELGAARDRSFGSSLARAAEAILYCRIPIERFIDIGTGPGFLLDALSTYLPSQSARFYGVEKYPPAVYERSMHANYLCADLADLADQSMRFECGVCIEVFEHLTPNMAASLAKAMAGISKPGSLFLFNTGLTHYVKFEDPGYLDPFNRGHIVAWSVTAARKIFERHGFVVHALRGKTWAFAVEMSHAHENPSGGLQDRIWTALPANKAILSDPIMGNVMYILGLESARAY